MCSCNELTFVHLLFENKQHRYAYFQCNNNINGIIKSPCIETICIRDMCCVCKTYMFCI